MYIAVFIRQVCSTEWWAIVHTKGNHGSIFSVTSRDFFSSNPTTAGSKNQIELLKKICRSLTPGLMVYMKSCIHPRFYERVPDKHVAPTPNTNFALSLNFLAKGGTNHAGVFDIQAQQTWNTFKQSIASIVALQRIVGNNELQSGRVCVLFDSVSEPYPFLFAEQPFAIAKFSNWCCGLESHRFIKISELQQGILREQLLRSKSVAMNGNNMVRHYCVSIILQIILLL